MIRRILGLIMLLSGLTILALALAGAYLAGDAITSITDQLTKSLTLAGESLDAARDTLDLSRSSIEDANIGLETAVSATANASQTLADSRPLIDNVAAVTTQEVPEAIEGMQAALPNMIDVAAVIDRTLVTLSSVGIDREIPLPFGGSIPLRFDLGIDYNPETSFDSSLSVFQASLDGLPESLRGLEDDLLATNASLDTLSGDLRAISDNMSTINARVDEVLPLLDQYSTLVDQLSTTITQVESQIGTYLELARILAVTLLIAIALSQFAPIYLGWELLTGRRRPLADTYAKETAPAYVPAPIVQVVGESPELPSAPDDGLKEAGSQDEFHHAQS